MDPPPPPIGNAAIRSRVTVVCTECKRLKLKCDRRGPCGSCIKRGTAVKCQYSVEARDKIDVQTLHNRILVIENTLQMQQQPPASADGRAAAARPTLAAGQLFVSIDAASALWIDQLQLAPADLAPADDDDDGDAAGRPGPGLNLPDPALFASGARLPPALLDALPPHDMRPHLLDALDDVLSLHSALHAAHLKARMLDLFDPAGPHPPPSWSFVALACAAWAIGSQTWLGSHRGERLDSPWTYDPDRLIDLSEHAVIVCDRTRREAGYDTDYIQALLLQMLFRLNDSTPRVHGSVYPALHKAVAAARSIGLGVDPGDAPGRFSLFEAETRRRVWWDLLYFDLFVSEALGHPHIIPDGSFSTTLPAECDDAQFDVHSNALPPLSNSDAGRDNSFIVLRSRLVQLFKGIKHRTSERNSELSLETAQACQADLQEWLSDVPPQLRFEPTSSESPSPVSPDEHAPGPVMLGQRAALVLLVQARVLQLFLPLAAVPKATATPAHFAVVSAAHAVVGASRHLLPAARAPHYFFARAAFAGAVACAVELLRDPAALLAGPAREAVADALSQFCATDGGPRGPAARVLRALLAKGRAMRRGPKAGEKRKRGAEDGAADADDGEEMPPGTVLPFLGPAICVARPAPAPAPTPPPPPPPAVPREREKEKEREPKPRPQLAIRVRPVDAAGKVKTEPGTPVVAPAHARREPVPIRPTPPSHAKPPQQPRKAPQPQPRPPPPPIAAAYVEGVPAPRRPSAVPMDTAPPPMDAYVSYADPPTTGPGMYATAYGPPPYAPYYYMPPQPEAIMYDVQIRGGGGGGEMMDVSGERAGSSASEGSGAPPPPPSRVWNTTDNTRFSRWTFDDQGWRETGEPEQPPS